MKLLRNLYDWGLHWSKTPNGINTMLIIAFTVLLIGGFVAIKYVF